MPPPSFFQRPVRALRNLVENALTHTPSGHPVLIVVDSSSNQSRISVRDWGPGIPPDKRDRIFERFWQGNRDRGGAGLGMNIVARTVAAHGGSIAVRDAIGGGALITLSFQLGCAV